MGVGRGLLDVGMGRRRLLDVRVGRRRLLDVGRGEEIAGC